MRVFTYGSLKRGQRNNILLRDSVFVQEAVTEPKYRLYDCGSYPCMVKDERNGQAIQGEVWDVDEDTLRRLDRLEGVPWLYQREAVALQGVEYPVIAYYYQEDIRDLADCGTSWPRPKAG